MVSVHGDVNISAHYSRMYILIGFQIRLKHRKFVPLATCVLQVTIFAVYDTTSLASSRPMKGPLVASPWLRASKEQACVAQLEAICQCTLAWK